ncbi:MAG: carbohydrate ABC transporter permease, partial [Gaiella sp.]
MAQPLQAVRRKLPTYLVVAPFAIVLAFPFYWMLVTMFKEDLDLYNAQNVPYVFNPLQWKFWESATTKHIEFLFEDTQYTNWIVNTAIVGVVVVAITLVFALPAGYALARLSGSWGQTAGIGIFLVYLIPPTLLFLPLSPVVARLGLQNSLLSLILVYPSFTIPFATWLLMGFFKTIPQELEDAALVDGCSRIQALLRIVFPVSLPGILTVVIFAFSLCVNEFIYAFTFISSSENRTISSGVPNEL